MEIVGQLKARRRRRPTIVLHTVLQGTIDCRARAPEYVPAGRGIDQEDDNDDDDDDDDDYSVGCGSRNSGLQLHHHHFCCCWPEEPLQLSLPRGVRAPAEINAIS